MVAFLIFPQPIAFASADRGRPAAPVIYKDADCKLGNEPYSKLSVASEPRSVRLQ